jgi:hypothetical protein
LFATLDIVVFLTSMLWEPHRAARPGAPDDLYTACKHGHHAIRDLAGLRHKLDDDSSAGAGWHIIQDAGNVPISGCQLRRDRILAVFEPGNILPGVASCGMWID